MENVEKIGQVIKPPCLGINIGGGLVCREEGKRNDATSIHLIVLGVLPKTRGDMCKMRVDSLHKTFR